MLTVQMLRWVLSWDSQVLCHEVKINLGLKSFEGWCYQASYLQQFIREQHLPDEPAFSTALEPLSLVFALLFHLPNS